MLPQSARTAAAYLGGGIARGAQQYGMAIDEFGKKITQAGRSSVSRRVGNFLESVGRGLENAGAAVGTQGGPKKRDVGLAAAGATMTGAFVGGIGANSGVSALMGYYNSDPRYQVQGRPGQVGNNVMPADLQTSYINLSQPGSPLGLMAMSHNYNIQNAKQRQRMLSAAVGTPLEQVLQGGNEEQ